MSSLLCTYSFTETDDWPERTSQGAAAADTATEQPLDVDRQRLAQNTVDSRQRFLELFRSNLAEKFYLNLSETFHQNKQTSYFKTFAECKIRNKTNTILSLLKFLHAGHIYQ